MKNKLIVALDVDSFEKAKKLVDKLAPYVTIFKVGSQLFVNSGPGIIKYIKKKRKKVFLDLKFFDIPNTVEKAVAEGARHGVSMLTLHATGGFEMLKKASLALRGRSVRPLLLGVTVLTSMKKTGPGEVVRLARMAKKAGLDGCVCSAKETKQVKKACGRHFIAVNPGVRPRGTRKNDQKRVTTPEEAIKRGADYIVIGRPVTKAKDPVKTVKNLVNRVG